MKKKIEIDIIKKDNINLVETNKMLENEIDELTKKSRV